MGRVSANHSRGREFESWLGLSQKLWEEYVYSYGVNFNFLYTVMGIASRKIIEENKKAGILTK